MLKKYPQIRSLMRTEPLTAYLVTAEVAVQFALAYYFRDMSSIGTWQFWMTAYWIGGTITSSLLLSVHEITHFLAFKSFLANKVLAVVANLPIVLPFCVDFKRYHMDHHRFQGVEGVDGDLPTQLEGYLFNSTFGKLFFCAIQILFYAMRPKLVATAKTYRMPKTPMEWIFSWYSLNYTVQFGTMFAVIYFWGLTSFLYLAASVLLGGSLHPMAGHFIAEHYVMNAGQETYSYYGALNLLAFNVGYHNEHHDFPNIPWTLLPELRKIAPEFYDGMATCESWTGTLIKFIFTPGLGPYSRIKRVADAAAEEKKVMPATVSDVSAVSFVGKEDL
ncbi:delta 15-fatty acid desaturase protein [Zopfochytrium polystomum]|nr:delta 15-fatty acid desaturase protein [Zopfochytrium polystomum]